MKGRVPKTELGGILVQAKCAAKNIRAQRDRLRHFQLQLQPTSGDADAPTEEVVSGLIRVYREGLEAGARYLAAGLTMTARSGEPPSLPLDFAAISDEQLFPRLLALRLPRRPVTQAQAFACLEAAFFAVSLTLRYCLTRCSGHLGHPKCATDDDDDSESSVDGLSLPDTTDDELQGGGEMDLMEWDNADAEHLAEIGLCALDSTATDTKPLQDDNEIRLSDPVTAATEHLAKISLSDPVAAATEDLAKIGLSDPDAAAPDVTPTAAIIDMNQARTYLEHACTLVDLAVKHVDLAVTALLPRPGAGRQNLRVRRQFPIHQIDPSREQETRSSK